MREYPPVYKKGHATGDFTELHGILRLKGGFVGPGQGGMLHGCDLLPSERKGAHKGSSWKEMNFLEQLCDYEKMTGIKDSYRRPAVPTDSVPGRGRNGE